MLNPSRPEPEHQSQVLLPSVPDYGTEPLEVIDIKSQEPCSPNEPCPPKCLSQEPPPPKSQEPCPPKNQEPPLIPAAPMPQPHAPHGQPRGLLREDNHETQSLVSRLNKEVQAHLFNIDNKLEELRMLALSNAPLRKRRQQRNGRNSIIAGRGSLLMPPEKEYSSQLAKRVSDRLMNPQHQFISEASLMDTSSDHPSMFTCKDLQRVESKTSMLEPPSPTTTRGASGPFSEKYETASNAAHGPPIVGIDSDGTTKRSKYRPAGLKRTQTAALQDFITAKRNQRGACAARIWRFIENPYSSVMAYLYMISLEIIVAISVLISVILTVDGDPLGNPDITEGIFETIFMIELCTRLFVCPDRWDFARDPFNYIDLMSSLPLLFRIVMVVLSLASDEDYNATRTLEKVACFVPVLRLLKLTRRFEKLRLLLSALMEAIEALPMLLYTLAVIALIFAAWVYRVEPEDNIQNLPEALWFTLVTMTTVGYGDIYPVTTFGRVATSILMLVSVLYMAVPIGIVGNAFSQVWGARDKLLLMSRMRDAFVQQGFGAKALEEIVRLFDDNGDGELGPEEFEKMLTTMHIDITKERMMLLMESLDDDGSGTINVDELIWGLFSRYTDNTDDE